MAPKDRVRGEELTYARQGDTTVLRPQASPVDTYVRPTEPLKSSLHDVAQSLAQVKPSIDRYTARAADAQAIEDAREAEAKGMVSTAKSWDEAIKNGEAPAGASPLYQRVFEETLGKVTGLNKAQATLWQEWVSPDNAIRTTQDPEVIAKWFQDRRGKFYEGKSPDWIKGFNPSFAQVQQQLTQKIIGDNVKYIEQANHDALGQLFMDRILAGSGKMSASQIAAQLADDSLPQRFAGMQGREINTIAAKAIIAIAKKTGRTDILQIGYQDRPDLKNPGKTIRGVFTIPEFAAAADDASTSILSKANAMETRAQLAEARAEKRVVKDTMTEIMTKSLEDPNYVPPKELLLKGVKADPSFMSHYRTQRKAARDEVEPRYDPIAFNKLATDFVDGIREGRDVTPVISAMAPYGTASQILQWNQMADRGANSDQSIFKSRAYAIADDSLKGMQDQLGRKIDPILASNNIRELRTQLLQYASGLERDLIKSDGRIDPDKVSKALDDKARQLGDGLAAKYGTPTTTGTAQPSPQQPQQQGAAQTPNAPASVTDSVNIVPLSKEASTGRWPKSAHPWTLPPGIQADANEINALRTFPFKTNAAGTPFWQSFEQKYGAGSVDFFMNNNQNAIGSQLRKWKGGGAQ